MKVFVNLILEVKELDSIANNVIFPRLMMFGQDPQDSKRHGRSMTRQILNETDTAQRFAAFLSPLLDTFFFMKRVHEVGKNIVQQLACVYNDQKRAFVQSFKTVDLNSVWGSLEKILMILITLDTIIKENKALKDGATALRKVLRAVGKDTSRFGGLRISEKTERMSSRLSQGGKEENTAGEEEDDEKQTDEEALASLQTTLRVLSEKMLDRSLFHAFANEAFHSAGSVTIINNLAFTRAFFSVIERRIEQLTIDIPFSRASSTTASPASFFSSSASPAAQLISPTAAANTTELKTPLFAALSSQSVFVPSFESRVIGVCGLAAFFPQVCQCPFKSKSAFISLWAIFLRLPVVLIHPPFTSLFTSPYLFYPQLFLLAEIPDSLYSFLDGKSIDKEEIDANAVEQLRLMDPIIGVRAAIQSERTVAWLATMDSSLDEAVRLAYRKRRGRKVLSAMDRKRMSEFDDEEEEGQANEEDDYLDDPDDPYGEKVAEKYDTNEYDVSRQEESGAAHKGEGDCNDKGRENEDEKEDGDRIKAEHQVTSSSMFYGSKTDTLLSTLIAKEKEKDREMQREQERIKQQEKQQKVQKQKAKITRRSFLTTLFNATGGSASPSGQYKDSKSHAAAVMKTLSFRTHLITTGLAQVSQLNHIASTYVCLYVALNDAFPFSAVRHLLLAISVLKQIQNSFYSHTAQVASTVSGCIEMAAGELLDVIDDVADRAGVMSAMLDLEEQDMKHSQEVESKASAAASEQQNTSSSSSSGVLTGSSLQNDNHPPSLDKLTHLQLDQLSACFLIRKLSNQPLTQSKLAAIDAFLDVLRVKGIMTEKERKLVDYAVSVLNVLTDLPTTIGNCCDCKWLYWCKPILSDFFSELGGDASLAPLLPSFCSALHDPLRLCTFATPLTKYRQMPEPVFPVPSSSIEPSLGSSAAASSEQTERASAFPTLASSWVSTVETSLEENIVKPLCFAVETRVRMDVQATLHPIAEDHAWKGGFAGELSVKEKEKNKTGSSPGLDNAANPFISDSSSSSSSSAKGASPLSFFSSFLSSSASSSAISSNSSALNKGPDDKLSLILCSLPRIRLFNRVWTLKERVGAHLSETFYQLTSLELSEWQTYAEMASLAEQRFGICVLDSHLPAQMLGQGMDVLEVARNLGVFVSRFRYSIEGQMFVEASGDNRTIRCLSATHCANSLRTHGVGMLHTAVNFVYQEFTRLLSIFCSFLADEHIKSFLAKEMKDWKTHRKEWGNCYPFSQAKKLMGDIRKLSAGTDDVDFLEHFRELIQEMGNALGFVRLLRCGAQRCVAGGMKFVMGSGVIHNEDGELGQDSNSIVFKEEVEKQGLSETTKAAAASLDEAVNTLIENFGEGTDFFQLFLDVFRKQLAAQDSKDGGISVRDAWSSEWSGTKTLHLRAFPLIVPALTIAHVDAVTSMKDALLKRRSGGGFCDDGFAMGCVFMISLLRQSAHWNSIHWFESALHHIDVMKGDADPNTPYSASTTFSLHSTFDPAASSSSSSSSTSSSSSSSSSSTSSSLSNDSSSLKQKHFASTEDMMTAQLATRKWTAYKQEFTLLAMTFDEVKIFYKE
eukprot:MONOS_4866.1-p1 / transcript=MONOS_4866.1 / gene=MONOS_4866 / organism=Monocercomonoides_exilis_PA203 / gene_product=WASH complex subunit SWIP / transcript_product=WASH complex subunit SWIP / location=Mono_scaffold00135:99510-104599(+) / protein_length=1575 / sequence_SO=supercontig / SO=protein_coding / is_pseudo=false